MSLESDVMEMLRNWNEKNLNKDGSSALDQTQFTNLVTDITTFCEELISDDNMSDEEDDNLTDDDELDD